MKEIKKKFQREIYPPAEDSFLLAECMQSFLEKSNLNKFKLNKKEMRILDMGSGSGIQSEKLIEFGIPEKNIVIIDINPLAIKALKKKFSKAKVITSDLFEKLNPEKNKFDLILFNPPYLPESKFDFGIDTTGGKNGSEVINRFLSQAKNYLKENAKILLLASSLTKKINWQSYLKKKVGKKRIFFETLYVWELSLN